MDTGRQTRVKLCCGTEYVANERFTSGERATTCGVCGQGWVVAAVQGAPQRTLRFEARRLRSKE